MEIKDYRVVDGEAHQHSNQVVLSGHGDHHDDEVDNDDDDDGDDSDSDDDDDMLLMLMKDNDNDDGGGDKFDCYFGRYADVCKIFWTIR